MLTPPAAPALDAPDVIDTLPDAPVLAAPLASDTSPLEPPSDEPIITEPLLLPAPLHTTTEPPADDTPAPPLRVLPFQCVKLQPRPQLVLLVPQDA